MLFFKPSKTTEPKILEFSQSIPFRSTAATANLSNNLSNSLSNNLQNTAIQESSSLGNLNFSSISEKEQSTLISGQSLLPILLTCTVFSTERVQRKWSISKSSNIDSNDLNDSISLEHEPDGSLLINDLNLYQLPINYTCTVSNSIGTDQVVYHLFKGKVNELITFCFSLFY